MLDLGRTFVASVERDPDACAIVDGDLRMTYAEWYCRISALTSGLEDLGLKKGDRVVSAMQNSWAAATLHWACQIAGLVLVPVNWRVTSEELDFFLENSEACALFGDTSSADAVAQSTHAKHLPVILNSPGGSFSDLATATVNMATPRAAAENISLMLYTSGTTAKPKGVPRRHRTERASAIAHIAQNFLPRLDRTLGVMPLYHTMGVRSLLAMSLLNGCFVCLQRFSSSEALRLIEDERIGSLYLVPTLYHDLLDHPDFSTTDVSSARRLGFAGASMTDGLLQRIVSAFEPEHFVNHYGSSEIYTFSVDQNAAAKPGSAGKSGLNQQIRVIALGSDDPQATLPAGVEGQIIATLEGDEAFEGYWRRPDADAKSLKNGWYFTGDSGVFDEDGDLFVTGRVDDMIITGGENVSPVEVESCLSMHPGVSEAAVVGLPDERWGKIVAAFVRRKSAVSEEELDHHCRSSGLANFKRPRSFVFVDELPKSPVGKLLRRSLVAGDYTPETKLTAE